MNKKRHEKTTTKKELYRHQHIIENSLLDKHTWVGW